MEGVSLSDRMKTYLQENGILHQISCPSTPQQNGKAERQNRKIVEVSLS